MKILFEEYQYEAEVLNEILSAHLHTQVSKSNHKRKINFVGYYCAKSIANKLSDPVLIFPKVFLNLEGSTLKAFGHFIPEDIINFNYNTHFKSIGPNSVARMVIYEMSVWLFRAIEQFRINSDKERISELGYVNPIISKRDAYFGTELEIVEALRLFYEENKNLFTFISRKSNSQKHKVNWSKTISRKKPVFADGKPIYFDVYSRVRKIDYDEELLRIFFSVLNDLNSRYGFSFKLNVNYELITGSAYKTLERRGSKYLKRIKYRYYNDQMLKLHGLLTMYFERMTKSKTGKAQEEYVLVKDFNIVFEQIIDKLIGDRAEGDILKMKNQPDHKQLDHIYRDKGIFQKDDVYFIADSKYYTERSKVDYYSSYKQFTYARNVLALNLDIFGGSKHVVGVRYQDKLTDGYHPTPNFFISAFYKDSMAFGQSGLKRLANTEKTAHWENRFFDRDTLFTLSYQINFMFVLQSYVRGNSSRLEIFKKETRSKFREEFTNYLDKEYSFYELTAISDFHKAIDNHFRDLLGISFCPSEDKDVLILAFEKNKKHRNKTPEELIGSLHNDWVVKEVPLSKYDWGKS